MQRNSLSDGKLYHIAYKVIRTPWKIYRQYKFSMTKKITNFADDKTHNWSAFNNLHDYNWTKISCSCRKPVHEIYLEPNLNLLIQSSNGNIGTMQEICSKLIIKTWCLYYQLWAYFLQCSGASIVDFEEVTSFTSFLFRLHVAIVQLTSGRNSIYILGGENDMKTQ